MNTTPFVTESGLSVSSEVYHAILAARMRPSIGRWAARRFSENHGVPPGLYRLACQLQAVS